MDESLNEDMKGAMNILARTYSKYGPSRQQKSRAKTLNQGKAIMASSGHPATP